jgi:FKBP-type peptidyl-prolyl cis-trans isomerase 2
MPLEFVCGVGDMIRGFDKAVAEMAVGDIIDVHLEPEEAYGMPNPNMIITVPKAAIQGLEGIETGDKVMLQDELGRPFDALVTAQDEENITFDCNHEMAGKALNFRIEMLEIE